MATFVASPGRESDILVSDSVNSEKSSGCAQWFLTYCLRITDASCHDIREKMVTNNTNPIISRNFELNYDK